MDQRYSADLVAGNLVANGGFENGAEGWSQASSEGETLIDDFSLLISANTGSRIAWLGGYEGGIDELSQDVYIPDGPRPVQLRFWYQIGQFLDSPLEAIDTLQVEVSEPGGQAITLKTLSNLNSTGGWVENPPLDLTAFRGKHIKLRFVARMGFGAVTSFLIDDVSIAPVGSLSLLPQVGWWWNPAEGGRGFALERQDDKIFLAAFMYDANGKPTWNVSTLTRQADGTFTGAMTRYRGGQTLLGTYRAPAGSTPEANATLAFGSATSGVLTVTPVQGAPTRSIRLERFPISAPAFQNNNTNIENGWWWNESQGGRGFFVEVQGSKAFVGGFMYDDAGEPTWYVVTANVLSGARASGTLQQYGGGQTLTGDYRSPQLLAPSPGTLSISSTSIGSATLVLPDGGQVALTRFFFNLPPVPEGFTTAPAPIYLAKNISVDQTVAVSSTSGSYFAIKLTAGVKYLFDNGVPSYGFSSLRLLNDLGVSVAGTSYGSGHFGWTPPATGTYFIENRGGLRLTVSSKGNASTNPYALNLGGGSTVGNPEWLLGDIVGLGHYLHLETPRYPVNLFAGETYRFKLQNQGIITGEATLTNGLGQTVFSVTVPPGPADALPEVFQNVTASASDTYYLQFRVPTLDPGTMFRASVRFIPN
ncbi:MAG: hypothetical protein AB7O72_11755 [Ramlibacter sp.]